MNFQVLSEGWAYPLRGFMREDQYLQTLHFNCLVKDVGAPTNQSLAIVLPVTTVDKDRLYDTSAIALCYEGTCYAILRKPEFFYHRKEERTARQFGTTNKEHPFIKIIYESGDWLVGGMYSVQYVHDQYQYTYFCQINSIYKTKLFSCKPWKWWGWYLHVLVCWWKNPEGIPSQKGTFLLNQNLMLLYVSSSLQKIKVYHARGMYSPIMLYY